ncbi:MAG: flagellar hook-length control protein FliK [Pyrinomonadaceae bacterium]
MTVAKLDGLRGPDQLQSDTKEEPADDQFALILDALAMISPPTLLQDAAAPTPEVDPAAGDSLPVNSLPEAPYPELLSKPVAETPPPGISPDANPSDDSEPTTPTRRALPEGFENFSSKEEYFRFMNTRTASLQRSAEIDVQHPAVAETPPIIQFDAPTKKKPEIDPGDTPPIIVFNSMAEAKGNEEPNSAGLQKSHFKKSSDSDELLEPIQELTQSQIETSESESPLKPVLETAGTNRNKPEDKGFAEIILGKFQKKVDLSAAEEAKEATNETPNLAEQVEFPILELISEVAKGKEPSMLKLRLRPSELGDIEIRLERDSHGKINLDLKTETEVAESLLSENIERLRESLDRAGWDINKIHVRNGADSSQSNFQHGASADGGQKDAEPFNPSALYDFEPEAPESLSADEDEDRLISIRA